MLPRFEANRVTRVFAVVLILVGLAGYTPSVIAQSPSRSVSPYPSVAPSAPAAPDVWVPVAMPIAPSRALGRWPGRWQRESRVGTLAPRTGAVVLDEYGVLVWGGIGRDGLPLNDGFQVLPSGEWRSIPAAPIAPRTDFAWSGDRAGNLVVWGGIDAASNPRADGAWYSIGRRWTPIAPGPLPAGPAAMAGDLNDMYVVTADPASGLPIMAVLHRNEVAAGTWSPVSSVPLPAGVRYEVISCCTVDRSTGEGWVIVLSDQADGFAYAARSGDVPGQAGWEQLGRVPVGPGTAGGPVEGYTDEDDLTAWIRPTVTPYPGTGLTGPMGVIARTWHPEQPWRLGVAPEAALDDPSLVLTPSHLVSVGGMVAWDLVTDRWLRIPSGRRGPGIVGATAWWEQGRLWVYGGRRPDGSFDRGIWTFTPRLPWRTFALPGRGERDSGEACYVYASEGPGPWRLRGDRRDPLLVWAQHGNRRVRLAWPDGWVVRFRPTLEIVRPDGKVVARDGHRCRIDNGSGG